MAKNRFPGLVFLYLLVALLTGVSSQSQWLEEQYSKTQLEPGRNVNMVSGTTLPYGDPWLQRQNEPSIAVSTRNPLHLLAGANDYRTVDIPFSEGELPGKAQGAMAGDAWLGIFKSFDGGESWITSLLPGFPQDTSAGGMASPLKQFTTAADPMVRAGTNGLFYYSGMAFNRAQTMGGGSLFVARFIDNNNLEGGDSIKYLDTKIIDTGTSGQFIDMPRMAVDMPRSSGTISIDGQNIPRSNVYVAYTVFLGKTDVNVRSRIMFRRSTDCGTTWGSAIKITESQHIIQGATIAIDPNTGAVYVAFRRFLHPSQPNSIVVVKSNDFGQTFSAPVAIANINPFDQPATGAGGDNISDPAGPSFRTNSYPTMTVDNNGIVYVAWTERGWGPTGEARIVMSTSQGGSGWTTPRPVINEADDYSFQGHQFMPHLTFAQGKLVLVWYDQRLDEYGLAYGHGNWISDNMFIRHTTDARCAQADPGLNPVFQPSVQVSKYLWALVPGSDTELEQEQFNPPNFEMFKGGTTPFHGDYIEVAPSPQFVLGPNGWKFNTEPSPNAVFHAVWTDNRDVRPPADGNWTNYTPPASNQPGFGSVACSSSSPSTAGMRNQNIYTSSLVQGMLAASPSSSKTLGDLGHYYDTDNGLIPRAFVVFVQNPGGDIKTFRLTIVDSDADGSSPWIDGSFQEFENLEELDVMIAPYSTVARTVFVRSSDEQASVQVDVMEIDGLGGEPVPGGLSGSVVLNPDPSSPVYSPSDEYHNPNIRNPNIVNWDELNPNIVNPNIRNPNIRNWDEINPNIVNPNIRNPNIVNPNIRNTNIVNPNIRNPNIVNPNIVNPNIRNYTEEDFDGAEVSDVVFTVKNDGNTTSTYTLKTYSKEALPDEVYAQLLVYRVHYTPSADYYNQTDSACELKVERHHQLILNVTNPNIRNPNIVNPNIRNPNIRNGGLDNATFAVPPGEEVEVILRVIDFEPETTQGQFRIMTTGQIFSAEAFAESIGFAVTSHAYNTQDARTIPEEELTYPATATKLIISTSYLPDGVVGIPYSATLLADGGKTPYGWALTTGELPPGLNLDGSSGEIYGTPTTAGKYDFIVRVDDIAGDFDTQAFSIYIDSDSTPDALTITTTSLPSGVLNYWYGATLEAVGGVWPRSWSLAGGSLPPGLSLDSTGVISGKILQEELQDYPTSYLFRARVNDKIGNTALRDFIIIVNINTKAYHTISGTVYDEFTGYPLGGVVMRGLPNTPVTDDSGYYSDQVPYGWSGTVTPFKAGHTFTPQSRTYSNVSSDWSYENYNMPEGVPYKLVFVQQPVNVAIGTTMTPVTVEIQDYQGNRVPSATNTVTISLNYHPSGGTLSGTTLRQAVNGVATFDDLSVNLAGLGHTLSASSEGLKGTSSETFDVIVPGTDESSAPGITTGTYRDTFGSGEMEHWFKVTLDESGKDIKISTSDAILLPPPGQFLDLDIFIYDSAGQLLTCAYSDRPDETVYLSNLTAGTYSIKIWSYENTRYTLSITVGDFVDIGEITGRITNSLGQGVRNSLVEMYPSTDPSWSALRQVGVTDANGYFKITHTPGTYKLHLTFNDRVAVPSDIYVLPQWYHGKSNSDEADVVSITAGSVTSGINVTLADGAAISGTLVYILGPIPTSTIIRAYKSDGTLVTGKISYGSNYTLGHIPIPSEGNVKLKFEANGYIVTWYKDYYSLEAADLIGLTPRTTFEAGKTDLRARAGGGSISGVVRDSGGNGIPGIRVRVYDFAQGELERNSALTNDTGQYTITQLPTLAARVYFDAGTTGYASQWYNGRSSFAEADVVNVNYGSATTGIDATLSTGAPGSPVKLAFVQQPTETPTRSIITPPVTVEIQDLAGNRVTSSTATVDISLSPGGPFGTLSGTTSKQAINGLATFDDLSIDAPGGGPFQLKAESSGLESAFSIRFAVYHPAVSLETAADGSGTLVPDQNIPAGSSITVYAIFRDNRGNFVENVAVDSWSLINISGGVVEGDLVPSADMKSAVFTGHLPGSAQIRAIKSGFTSGDTGVLTVVVGSLEGFTIILPQSGIAGTPFSANITAKDAYGNTTTNVTGETALTVDSGTISPTSIPAAEFQDDGVWTGNITLSSEGNRTITATNSGKTGSDTIRIWTLITSATDPNEAAIPDGKDFESIYLYRSNNRLRSAVKFYDIIALSYPFFIYVDGDGDSTPEIRITCGLTGFEARTYPAGELIYAGTPSVIKDTYIMDYIWTDVFPTSPIRIWLLTDDRDGYDKLPDGTGVIIVNF